MKRIIATSLLLFVFTVLFSVNSYSQTQTQEPVKTVQVKQAQCCGHASEATKTDEVKSGDTKKSCCSKAGGKKCSSKCSHMKAAEEKKTEPANTDEKKTLAPQK